MQRLLVTAWAGMLFAFSAQAQEGPLRLGVGFHHSEGDYDSAVETRINTFEATARYEAGRMVYRASVPYLDVKGDTGVIPGIGQARGAPVRSGSASGLGDIVLSAAYAAYYNPASTLGMDLTGKVKLPTADESEGLGTGEMDFAILLDLFKTFDALTGFGGVGFHIMGDSPALPLENAWSANLGATLKLDQRDSVGAMLEGRERVAPGGARMRELTAFWMRRLGGEWRSQVYGLVGLADGSPDWGFGLSLAHAF